MTKSRNFPHLRFLRRQGALNRLWTRLEEFDKELSEEPTPERRAEISRKYAMAEKEIAVLQERTKGTSGRKSTKKVHANTGRK